MYAVPLKRYTSQTYYIDMATIHPAGFQIVEHPPYPPNLVSSNSRLFPKYYWR